MEITKEWLEKNEVCADGTRWFLAQGETDSIKIVQKFIVGNQLEWANWLLVRLMDYNQYVSYAIFAAEKIMDLYEQTYHETPTPRGAIELAKKCIENPTKENKEKAAIASACASAYASAYSAGYSIANYSIASYLYAVGTAGTIGNIEIKKKMKHEILSYGLHLLGVEMEKKQ